MRVETFSINPDESSRGSRRKVHGRPEMRATKTAKGDPMVEIRLKDESLYGTGDRGGDVRVVEKKATVVLHAEDLVALMGVLEQLDIGNVDSSVVLRLAKHLINQAV